MKRYTGVRPVRLRSSRSSGRARQFRRLFSHLPIDAQHDAKGSYHLFRTNPPHPGLPFKKLQGEDNIEPVRMVWKTEPFGRQQQRSRRAVLDRQSLRARPFGLRSAVRCQAGPAVRPRGRSGNKVAIEAGTWLAIGRRPDRSRIGQRSPVSPASQPHWNRVAWGRVCMNRTGTS